MNWTKLLNKSLIRGKNQYACKATAPRLAINYHIGPWSQARENNLRCIAYRICLHFNLYYINSLKRWNEIFLLSNPKCAVPQFLPRPTPPSLFYNVFMFLWYVYHKQDIKIMFSLEQYQGIWTTWTKSKGLSALRTRI